MTVPFSDRYDPSSFCPMASRDCNTSLPTLLGVAWRGVAWTNKATYFGTFVSTISHIFWQSHNLIYYNTLIQQDLSDNKDTLLVPSSVTAAI